VATTSERINLNVKLKSYLMILGRQIALSFLVTISVASNVATARETRNDECVSSPLTNQSSARLRIGRDLAAYVVLHLRKSCTRIFEATADGAPLAASRSQLRKVAQSIVVLQQPFYRAHPYLRNSSLPLYRRASKVVPIGNPANLSHRSAIWLKRNTTKLGAAVTASAKDQLDQAAEKQSALDAVNAVTDIVAELNFASKIAYDAYPAFWRTALTDAAAVVQPRTAETDETYRKSTPRLGSVSLSESARALIGDFYKEVKKLSPAVPQVVSVFWTEEARSKSPTDTNWKVFGPGLRLGSQQKQHYPPDVVDQVDGIAIVFSVPDPKLLEGKIIDVRNNQLFIRD
jgi:hypothetical protein